MSVYTYINTHHIYVCYIQYGMLQAYLQYSIYLCAYPPVIKHVVNNFSGTSNCIIATFDDSRGYIQHLVSI